MSTKTTFKRVALVAVAALGFGMLSVVPSNAGSTAVAVTATTTVVTASPTAGETVTILVNMKGFTTAAAGDNYPYQVINTGWGAVPAKSTTTASPVIRAATAAEKTALGVTSYGSTTGFLKGSTGATPSTNCTVGQYETCATANAQTLVYDNAAAGSFSQYAIVTFIPDVAGTWSVQIIDPDRASYYVYTATVTVAAKADPSATASTIALTAAADGYATLALDGTTVAGVSGSKTAGKTVGTATLTIANSATSTLLAADAPKITATVTGPGLVSWAGGSTGKSVVSAGAQLSPVLTIYSDGAAGDGKVTFTYTNAAGTVVEIGSKTVSFFGAVASIKTVLYHTVVPVGLFSSTGAVVRNDVVRAIAYDSNGTIVKGASLYMTSGSQAVVAANVLAPTTACSTSSGRCYWKTTGVGAGTTTLTIVTGADATATGYVSQAVGSVRVGSTSAKSIKIAFDKKEYVPGELATITVTALDADGLVVADSTGAVSAFYAGLGGLVSDNFVFTSGGTELATATDAATIVIDGGVATYYVNMPMATGTLYVSGVGAATLSAAQAGATVSSDVVTIGNGAATQAAIDAGQAATDAAAEATDAANAATDAANAAAEAADAATAAAQDAADAVAALSAQVATLISGLKSQLTALTNLVIKIQKKVKA